MGYPQTGSTLGGPNGENKTSTGISTNIIIRVGKNTVGAIQTLDISEERGLQMIDEFGTDGHIDSVPKASTNITGGCKRIRFDGMRIAEAFSRGFVHVSAQRLPFDIVIIDNWNGSDGSSLITTIKNVWIKSISHGFNATDWVISDDMKWEAETIYTTLGDGNGQAANGGSRNLPLSIDDIERQADRGARRGGLDFPGLLKAFSSF